MKKWIPDCYWPGASHGSYLSHESICVLNTEDRPAHLALTLYFEDREPLDGFAVLVGARRTRHIRMDALISERGDRVPRDTPYAVLLESDEDVAVQYTRVDTTQSELALMTTVV